MKKVVVIGGGSGLATLLRGLRDYPLDITAIVTMTDDGASSGRLRKDFNLLPPGDIRKCIAALSENETSLTELFQYRFKSGLGLDGHSLGNLLITAMEDITGNFELGIEEVSKLLNIKGRVLPVTLEDVDLIAKFDDGKEVLGESQITKYGYDHKILSIGLTKKTMTNPRALAAVMEADMLIVGPGSLYTSIIPNFLQKKMSETFQAADAFKLYICNTSTERGETMGFSVSRHMSELKKYSVQTDAVLVNSRLLGQLLGDDFVTPVGFEPGESLGIIQLAADVVNTDNPLYHDSAKLAAVIWKILARRTKFTKSDISGKIIEL